MTIIITSGRTTSSESTISDGQQVNTEVDIGTAPTILLWDGLDGTNGQNLPSSPQRGSWTLDNRPTAQYTTTNARVSGKTSAYALHNNSQQWSMFTRTGLPDVLKFYQSFWFRISGTTVNGQIKLNQWHGNEGEPSFAPGVHSGTSADGWFSYIEQEGGGTLPGSIWISGDVSKDVWHHVEFIMRQSSAGNAADGYVEMKIDNVSRRLLNNTVTRTTLSRWVETSFLHGGTNFGSNVEYWTDDPYLQSGHARIELGDNAVYADCTVREPQLIDSFSNGVATYTANKGGLSSGSVWEFATNDSGTLVSTKLRTMN